MPIYFYFFNILNFIFILKNSKIIIERLKERSYELTEEDGYEDEINMNIPIRTREKNY